MPASMEALGSELRLRRRKIILAWDLTSESSFSICSSSTDAASMRPVGKVSVRRSVYAGGKGTVKPGYLCRLHHSVGVVVDKRARSVARVTAIYR